MSKELCVYIYAYVYIYTEVKPPQFCCASPETAWKKPYITTSLIYIYIYICVYVLVNGWKNIEVYNYMYHMYNYI